MKMSLELLHSFIKEDSKNLAKREFMEKYEYAVASNYPVVYSLLVKADAQGIIFKGDDNVSLESNIVNAIIVFYNSVITKSIINMYIMTYLALRNGITENNVSSYIFTKSDIKLINNIYNNFRNFSKEKIDTVLENIM